MIVRINGYYNQTLAVRFTYDDSILNAVRSIPHRRWNAKDKFWTIPDTRDHIEELLQALYKTGLFSSQLSSEDPPAVDLAPSPSVPVRAKLMTPF